MALKLVSGVDVWLNTPLRPREASGTSGMKAAHNGVINFSILDGWWIEDTSRELQAGLSVPNLWNPHLPALTTRWMLRICTIN